MTDLDEVTKKAKKAEYQKRWRDKKKMKELEKASKSVENVENSTQENVENVENSTQENVDNVENSTQDHIEKELEIECMQDGKPHFYCSECGKENEFCADKCSNCGENLDWRGVLDSEIYDDFPKFPCDNCGLALDLDDPDLEENKPYACPRCGWKFMFPTGYLAKYKEV